MNEQVIDGVIISWDNQGHRKVHITCLGKYLIPESTFKQREFHQSAQDTVKKFAGEMLTQCLLLKHRSEGKSTHQVVLAEESQDMGNNVFIYHIDIYIDMRKEETPDEELFVK